MLDKAPAWLRHLIIVFGAAFLGSIAAAIMSAHGVSTLDFGKVVTEAVDLAAYSTAATAAALWLTPLTRQYGIGSSKEVE